MLHGLFLTILLAMRCITLLPLSMDVNYRTILAVEARHLTLRLFLKSLAQRVSAPYTFEEMLTAREIANQLAFPAGPTTGSLKRAKAAQAASRAHPPIRRRLTLCGQTSSARTNAAAAAEQDRMFERMRHWTREGLLSPAGEKNPGTGRSRLYDESAFRKARVLNSLTECGVTVRNLHVISDFLDSNAAEWLTKTDDRVYLVIQKFRWVEERNMQIRHLAKGDTPELTFRKTARVRARCGFDPIATRSNFALKRDSVP